jgi:predicted nucleic acid-binding protein
MTLVDTGPLVAVCDPRDGRHATALTHLEKFAPAGLQTCEAVLTEACFHLPSPAQRQRLFAAMRGLRVEIVPTRDLQEDVFSWLLKYADHTPDWADACLAVLSSRNPALRVWTYDRGFRTTWRTLGGGTIPLAVR